MRKRTDIVIKKADKGSATVVMSRDDYISKVRDHLDNENYYQKLNDDPTERFSSEIRDFLLDMVSRQAINKETMLSIAPETVKASRFYILPKIHKRGNPGRPIVSSCGAPTEGISRFVDYHLNPLVKKIPSYIKDTSDFLLKLERLTDLPPDPILVTLDVKSLYTNIPHDEGIVACKLALDSREVLQPPTEDLVRLMKMILTMNNFTFDDENYLQLHGTAMGTRMAPSYANIFMGLLESRLLEAAHIKPSVWWRFIDDVFMIWPFSEGCLNEFLGMINNAHPTIKFTAEWSRESVSFLDVKVRVCEGRLTTDLHTKPTDTHQYLHRYSCHPGHCKSAIPYSQALRLRRICSRQQDYILRAEELREHLVERGYDRDVVQGQIDRATIMNREDTFNTAKVALDRVPLVATYHPDRPNVREILCKHLPTLHISPKMTRAVPEPPLVANRRPRNLKDLLVRASLKPPQINHEGSSQCRRPRCKTCAHIKTGTRFDSATTGETFHVRATANCKTRNVVYLIECRICNKQYVGETENALHLRMNGHRSDYNRKLSDKPVARHFNSVGHTFDDLSVMVIEQLWKDDASRRKLRESYWIHTLGSLTPQGLNMDP